jgi:MerR family transcriptional regulator, copper efflux regulator
MQAFLGGIYLKIQELAQKTGLTVYTIRFYEKEGLLDSRHIAREKNNYRNYSDMAVERLKFVKKFQGIGCSLTEIRNILQEKDEGPISNLLVMEWIRHKISEVERKKEDYDQILDTLHWMLEYRIMLESDPQQAHSMFTDRHSPSSHS